MNFNTFYPMPVQAANDHQFNIDFTLIESALDRIIASGDFDFALSSTWTKQMVAEYLLSKSIGFIPLAQQAMLSEQLMELIKIHLN